MFQNQMQSIDILGPVGFCTLHLWLPPILRHASRMAVLLFLGYSHYSVAFRSLSVGYINLDYNCAFRQHTISVTSAEWKTLITKLPHRDKERPLPALIMWLCCHGKKKKPYVHYQIEYLKKRETYPFMLKRCPGMDLSGIIFLSNRLPSSGWYGNTLLIQQTKRMLN